MIGKWHLGYHKWEYTPTYRGFDTFYGFYNGWGDHYSHEIDNILDLRDNKEAVRDLNGTFATFAFSKVIMLFELTWMNVFSVSIKATACPSRAIEIGKDKILNKAQSANCHDDY